MFTYKSQEIIRERQSGYCCVMLNNEKPWKSVGILNSGTNAAMIGHGGLKCIEAFSLPTRNKNFRVCCKEKATLSHSRCVPRRVVPGV